MSQLHRFQSCFFVFYNPRDKITLYTFKAYLLHNILLKYAKALKKKKYILAPHRWQVAR